MTRLRVLAKFLVKRTVLSPDKDVENLYCNKTDKLYVVTMNNIYIVDINTCKPVSININLNQNNHSTPSDNLNSMFIDSHGLFWIGRYNDIWIYNPKTNNITVIDYNHGITGNYVRSLLEDDKK